MQLNERQEQVASFRDGRVVVVAGPGSGKTRTLVERIRRLLDAGVEPAGIVTFTFTVRAAQELASRLAEHKGTRHLGYVGTIHGYCHHLLRSYPQAQGALGTRFTVLDEQDRFDLHRRIAAERNLKTPIPRMQAILERTRLEAGPEAKPPPVDKAHLDAAALQESYRTRKVLLRAEDFDGLIDRARAVLLQNPEVLHSVQRATRHLSVDEAQDLDRAQEDLIDLIAPPEDAIPVAGNDRSTLFVGDPVQAIYGWRGGDRNILLERTKTAHLSVVLNRNYRSPPEVVELCNRVAADDNVQAYVDYRLEAYDPEPGTVLFDALTDETSEAEFIASALLPPSLIPYGNMAILGRTNAVVARVGAVLQAAGIPIQILGARRARLETQWCRRAIAYLRAALNPMDDEALLRVLIPPSHATDLEARIKTAANGLSIWGALDPDRMRSWPDIGERLAIETERNQIVSLQMPHAAGWSGAVDDVWGKLASRLTAYGLTSGAEDVTWLRELLGEYVSGRIPGGRKTEGPTMAGFAWWLSFGQGPGEHDPAKDAVTLSTVHLAKGLEWACVFLPGMYEKGFPSAMALRDGQDGIDEERRVFYVAASRAGAAIYLTRPLLQTPPWKDKPERTEPSRFLAYAKVDETR